MDRETVIAVGGFGGTIVAATAVSATLLTPQAGLGVGAFAFVTAALGFVLYRHITRLQAQQAALEQQVEQQREKTTSYRRQFQQTQNQLEAVKEEVSNAQGGETSAEEATQAVNDAGAQADAGTAGAAAPGRASQATTRESSPARASPSQQATRSSAGGDGPSATATTEREASKTTAVSSGSSSSATSNEATSLATVVEEAWDGVETHSVVLEIVDTERLRADEAQLQSALQRLIRTVTEDATDSGGQETGQVFTSRAIAVRAQHRNPHSDVTLQNDGGYSPRRRSSGRQVVRVGTTDTGVYVDCTTDLAVDGRNRSKQRAELEALQKQVANHGWTLGVSKHDAGHRIEIGQIAHA